MKTARSPSRADEGFGVLEAIVALIVAALALQALYGATSASLRSAQRSKVHLNALALAQSHLATLGVIEPLTPGETRGAYADGTLWRITTTNLSRLGVPDPAPPYWIVHETFDQSGARLTHLETSRTGPPQS